MYKRKEANPRDARNYASVGFPSPAADYMESGVDLNLWLITRPAASFFLRVSGPAMQGAGILDGDYLLVDRSLAPAIGRVVVAAVDGELTVKILQQGKNGWVLQAAHPAYPDEPLPADSHIWGIVTAVIRKL